MGDFFAMGGYAAYIWPCYAISLAVIAGMIAWTFTANAKAKRRLAALESTR